MLVLGRKITERIIVEHAGERLVIEIVEARGDKARIGLNGPKSFVVLRDEVSGAADLGPRRAPMVDKSTLRWHAKHVRNRFGMEDVEK